MGTDTNSGGKRALLVGCGELGSRHLQALASVASVREIEVVEPRPEGQALGQRRLKEAIDPAQSTKVRWLSSLEEASRGGDVCILATQADIRGLLLHEIAETKDYSSFLLEKMVTPSVPEYEELMQFSKNLGLSVWVNCKSRAQYSHKRAKKHLGLSGNIYLNAFGGNHGLVTNGVHIADLFCFYDGSDRIFLDESAVDPVLHSSKRGANLFDLSGCLTGHSESGSRLKMTLSSNHTGPMFFSVASQDYRASINDETKCLYESNSANGWEWNRIPYDENIFVSYITRIFVSEILSTGKCELPTLEECYPAHKFVLGELLGHFNKLLGTDGDRCPVT